MCSLWIHPPNSFVIADPYNKVVFKFDTNITMDASNRFDITENGKITVFLRNGADLNRDKGPANFKLPILAFDNPKGFYISFLYSMEIKILFIIIII